MSTFSGDSHDLDPLTNSCFEPQTLSIRHPLLSLMTFYFYKGLNDLFVGALTFENSILIMEFSFINQIENSLQLSLEIERISPDKSAERQ